MSEAGARRSWRTLKMRLPLAIALIMLTAAMLGGGVPSASASARGVDVRGSGVAGATDSGSLPDNNAATALVVAPSYRMRRVPCPRSRLMSSWRVHGVRHRDARPWVRDDKDHRCPAQCPPSSRPFWCGMCWPLHRRLPSATARSTDTRSRGPLGLQALTHVGE